MEEVQSDWHQQGRKEGYGEKGVPDAPFKKNWHELALKHALGMAAKGGYEGIAITPGDIQAKRWDKPGLKVQYDTTIPSFLNKLGKPHGAQVQIGGMPVVTKTMKLRDGQTMQPYERPIDQANLHYFPITDSLRQQIKQEGLPQYEQGGKVKGLDHFFDSNNSLDHFFQE